MCNVPPIIFFTAGLGSNLVIVDFTAADKLILCEHMDLVFQSTCEIEE